MSIFRPPKSNYSDFYDLSKLKLIWNFGWAIIFILSIVSLSNITNVNYSQVPNIVGISIAAICLFIIKITGRYEVISLITIIGILIVVSLTFLFLRNTPQYTTPLWMILNILLGYFILGRFGGTIVLICHFTVLFFYFAYFFKSNLENMYEMTRLDIINYIIEAGLIGFGIFYILSLFVKTTRQAEKQVKEINRELIKKNEVVIAQNEEKEIMLKEIHHRVKNNLQVITSLLRLQSMEIESNETKDAFNEAITRVKSMALIHEKMYKNDSLADFDLKSYLESLVNDLIDAYNVKKPISIQVKLSIDSVGNKSVVPLSLLFNELISNSIKHGFKDKDSGDINVEISRIDVQTYKLIYQDNGTWVNGNSNNFGTELIESMTKQLDGSFELYKEPNKTTYTFLVQYIDQ